MHYKTYRKMKLLSVSALLLLMLLVPLCSGKQNVDYVLEGQDVTLDCNIPREVPSSARLYWMGPVNGSMDNYAIDGSTFNKDYKVNFIRSEGRYDLIITKATYNRNNGLFVCRVKQEGTGFDLHSKSINLTVLIKPGSPRISPLNPTVTQGHPISLTCASQGGSPDPNIFWVRKSTGEKMQGVLKPGGGRDFPTTSVLRLDPKKEDDGEEFSCHVSNRALSVNEKMVSNVRLNVNYYPIVQITPSNPVRVIEGQDVTLMCNVDAKPAVQNVRWMRGGIFMKTTNALSIRSASLDDAGRYICRADNHLGRLGEAEVTVDVLYPPIVSVPKHLEVIVGDSVTVRCNVTANPAPISVFWTKIGDDSFSQSRENLQLNHVTSATHGEYVCNAVSVVPSGNEKLSLKGNQTIKILVRHKPGKSFILPYQPVAVEGNDVVLTCGAQPPGYPHPQYRWWKDGSQSMVLSEDFTIQKVNRAVEGTYFCQPFNIMGNGSVISTKLRVFQAPEILEGLKPSATHKREIVDLQLSCRAQGQPKPVAKWFKDGLEIDQLDGLYIVQVQYTKLDEERGFKVLSTLLFRGPDRIGQKGLRPEDRGKYECSFGNEAKQVSSSQLLRIQHSPAVAHKQSKAAFDVGEDAYLTCRMRAFPKPSFTWSHNRIEIPNVNSGRYSINFSELEDDMYRSVLKIRRINIEDYGAYTCKASNDEGSSKTILNLQHKALPEISGNLEIMNVGFNFLELTFDAGFDGGYPKEVSYSAQITTSSFPGGDLIAPCSATSCRVEGLRQNTEYTIRVFSENAQGQSELSSKLVARTALDPKSIPAPSQVFVQSESGMVIFAVPEMVQSSAFKFIARLEVQHGDSTDWAKVPVEVPLRDFKGEFDLGPITTKSDARVQLCAKDTVDMCGPFAVAKHVSVLPRALVASGAGNIMIIIIVGVVAVVVFLFVVALVCCCCRQQRNSKLKKKAQMEVSHRGVVTQQAPPPPYYTVGLENKGMEGSIDRLNEHNKSLIYGSQQQYQNYPQNHNNQGGVNFMDNSYSNSNNGGSVNSQDSLWQVKGHPNQQSQQQQHQPLQQQQQQQQQHQQQHHQGVYNTQGAGYGGYEDYAHYPQEEYPRNTYDPYSSHKPARGLEDDGYDVSGMPNPYVDHNPQMSPALHNPQMNPELKPSFDESLESGFSTPNSRNRRIIREIIV